MTEESDKKKPRSKSKPKPASGAGSGKGADKKKQTRKRTSTGPKKTKAKPRASSSRSTKEKSDKSNTADSSPGAAEKPETGATGVKSTKRKPARTRKKAGTKGAKAGQPRQQESDSKSDGESGSKQKSTKTRQSRGRKKPAARKRTGASKTKTTRARTSKSKKTAEATKSPEKPTKPVSTKPVRSDQSRTDEKELRALFSDSTTDSKSETSAPSGVEAPRIADQKPRDLPEGGKAESATSAEPAKTIVDEEQPKKKRPKTKKSSKPAPEIQIDKRGKAASQAINQHMTGSRNDVEAKSQATPKDKKEAGDSQTASEPATDSISQQPDLEDPGIPSWIDQLAPASKAPIDKDKADAPETSYNTDDQLLDVAPDWMNQLAQPGSSPGEVGESLPSQPPVDLEAEKGESKEQQPEEPPDAKDAETSVKKKKKRVAKTLVEERKVAKTMLETEIPVIPTEEENDQTSQAVSPTLIDQDARDFSPQAADEEESETEAEPEPEELTPCGTVKSEEPETPSDKKVAKTLLETDISAFSDIQSEEAASSSIEQTTALEDEQPESSPQAIPDSEASESDLESQEPGYSDTFAPIQSPISDQTVIEEEPAEQLADAESDGDSTDSGEVDPMLMDQTAPMAAFDETAAGEEVDQQEAEKAKSDQADLDETPAISPAEEGPERQVVAKTMLDKDLIFKELSASMQRLEVIEEQKILEKAEAAKDVEHIENFNIASPCPWTWDDPYAKEKFAYCEQCGKQVYNFEGLDMPQARALIFKRENLEKFKLFKREDGKFMTSDCPMAAKKRSKTIWLIAAAVVVFVLFFVVGPMLMPPQPSFIPDPGTKQTTTRTDSPAPSSTSSADTTTTDAATTPASKKTGSAPAESQDGTYHWKEGDPIPEIEDEPQPKPEQNTSKDNSPYADESGKFWEYSQ